MTSQHQPTLTLGSFSRMDAFAAVRSLEHAGIHAEVKRTDETYQVLVAHECVERALSLV